MPTQAEREEFAAETMHDLCCIHEDADGKWQSANWFRVDNAGRASALRSILGVVDRERVERETKILDVAWDWRDHPASNEAELRDSIDALRELTRTELAEAKEDAS